MSVTTASIFKSFLGAGMISFGGAMPHVQKLVVEKQKWMDAGEFSETVGLCQFIPGPNATNVSICVGHKVGGFFGAVSAAVGLLFFPICFALIIAVAFTHYAEMIAVRQVAQGMALSGSGLLLGAGLKLLSAIKRDRTKAYLTVGLVLVLAGYFKFPLLTVIGSLLIISLLVTWIELKGGQNESI